MRVLVIDDDSSFCAIVRLLLAKNGYEAVCVSNLPQAMEVLRSVTPAVVLLDWQLGSQDGLEHLPSLRTLLPDSPIILITASASTELVVRAIKVGAFDFLPKPIEEPRLVATLSKAVEHHRLLMRMERLQSGGRHEGIFEGMVGVSAQMRTIFGIIENVAATDVSVMICGASGTGKELVARAIHRRSSRSGAPFVALNMAALPKDLAESTLFGHERGAFTGADRKHTGACEEAQNGTLFLDEIGEMALELQSKLLRFLQERVFRRVGGSQDLTANLRIISATNREPVTEVRAGRLRADVYYRLNVVPIVLPPLRQRSEDIPLLAQHALREFAAKYVRKFEYISPAAMEILVACEWPGNIRQLRHLIERIVVLNNAISVTPEMLPADLLEDGLPGNPSMELALQANQAAPVAAVVLPRDDEPVIPLAQLERQAITRALDACGGSASLAATKLEISTATIYRKIKEWGLSVTG